MWDKTSKALEDILEANDKIATVYNYEASNLESTPVATLTGSANEADYHTTTENSRVYSFMLRLFVDRPSGEEGEYNAEGAMKSIFFYLIFSSSFPMNRLFTLL